MDQMESHVTSVNSFNGLFMEVEYMLLCLRLGCSAVLTHSFTAPLCHYLMVPLALYSVNMTSRRNRGNESSSKPLRSSCLRRLRFYRKHKRL